ncbi:MAG: hypothetical protein SGILL_004300 [Bacillariaceae sp.]
MMSQSHNSATSTSTSSSTNSSQSSPQSSLPFVLKSINASALLNPRNYCANSAKSTHTHNVSRSINGTDAARRLLRGKKDFFVAAKQMVNVGAPLLLEGHTVPPQLLQHCIDMADQLLRHYGKDVEECSFHNYHQEESATSRSNSNHNSNNQNGKVSLPMHVRVRQRDGTNACMPPPHAYDPRVYSSIDWEYHLELYLTVMQNFANPLGKIFENSSGSSSTARGNELHPPSATPTTTRYNGVSDNTTTTTPTQTTSNSQDTARRSRRPLAIDEYRFDNDEEDGGDGQDFTASPLLFESPPPRWNVDIMKGAVYDLRSIAAVPSTDSDNNNDDNTMIGTVTDLRSDAALPPPPFPLVEFVQESSQTPGHVLIRLQGIPGPSAEFGTDGYYDGQQQKQKRWAKQLVTLTFDAGYYPSRPSMAAYSD